MPSEATRVLQKARLAVAFAVVLQGATTAPSSAAAARHAPALGHVATDRQAVVRSGAHRRDAAQRQPAPELWNPLKRKRMAMPAPPATDVDYAF